ncbi:endonuclease-reverse transcriptase [Trichonephila clavipes]|uniref:Endonuclease-reverse transcriptase n=1 Tax=Trichonephila clavipes TaxID=2585209 RepID=A0A8X6SB70_TRICX|nr:endonuclease-reverse transcriptase [Trichonephila clavipes]
MARPLAIWRSPENNQTRAYTFKNPMGSRTRERPPARWIDDVENDLKTLNIKTWQRVAAYRWNWRKRAVEAAETCSSTGLCTGRLGWAPKAQNSPNKLDLPDFLVLNFDPPAPRWSVELLRSGPEMNLNRHRLYSRIKEFKLTFRGQ